MSHRGFIIAAGTAVLGLAALAGAKALAPDRLAFTRAQPGQVTIGFAMDTLREERWQRDRKYFVERCEQLGAKVIVQAANNDDGVQLAQGENLLTLGVDVLVVVPHNGSAAARLVQAAHRDGIKVISYERLIRNVDVDFLVSVDAVRVGEIQAEYALAHKPKGRYMLIEGGSTDTNSHLVYDGHMNVLKPAMARGDVTIVAKPFANDWMPSEALRLAENTLTSEQNRLDAMVVANDGMAGGAIQALAGQKLAGKVLVTGQDFDLAACQRIVAGTQTMTVFKSVRRIAYTGAEVAVAMAKGQPLKPTAKVDNGYGPIPAILVEPVAADKGNIDRILADEGVHTREAVYGSGGAKKP
ncbi:MAG: substrate-binding domain-containing protein [Candidatus Sericytochromatia bacterium]|nr:substrate-binding domain-containing protein [Candidatus Sericytochromatia bacterium]